MRHEMMVLQKRNSEKRKLKDIKVKWRKIPKENIMEYRLSLASTADVADDDVIVIRPVRKMAVTKVRGRCSASVTLLWTLLALLPTCSQALEPY